MAAAPDGPAVDIRAAAGVGVTATAGMKETTAKAKAKRRWERSRQRSRIYLSPGVAIGVLHRVVPNANDCPKDVFVTAIPEGRIGRRQRLRRTSQDPSTDTIPVPAGAHGGDEFNANANVVLASNVEAIIDSNRRKTAEAE